MKIIKYIENKPKSFLFVIALALVVVIGSIEKTIPAAISTSIFYLVPVCLTTWFVGEKPGILICIASGISSILATTQTSVEDPSLTLPAINYWNASVRLGFYLTVSYLLSELKSAREREQKLIRTDSITGVANRRLFNELATMEIKRARRYGHPFTLAYIDVDDFKNINTYGGHKVGDLVLVTIAKSIKNSVRETDIVARMGGDEFALLLPGISYETAQTVLTRVYTNLMAVMDENKWPATFSIGAITFINPPETIDEVIEKSDYLMYCIKNDGKNKLEHIIEQGTF